MQQLLLFILLVVSIAIVVLILLQHGKGADAGAAFGSGASSTVFGSQGSTSFLMKLTGVLVAIFFAVCILLTRLASVESKPPGPTEKPLPVQTAPRQAATTVPTTTPSAPKDSAASTVPSTPKK